MHRLIGGRVEAGYGEHAKEIAAELAVYFEQAQDYSRAVRYLEQAARKAIQQSAHQEAIVQVRKALVLLQALPDTSERTQQEIILQITLGIPLTATQGYAVPEVGKAYTRARELCQQVGENLQLFPVLHGLYRFYVVRAEYQMARELGEQLLRLAEHQQDPALLLKAHLAMGIVLLYQGEPGSARSHLAQGATLYDFRQHSSHVFTYGQDPGVCCQIHEAWALWFLGYPDQALKRSLKALSLAQEVAHRYSLAFALHYVALTYQFRQESLAAQKKMEELIRFAKEREFPFWLAMASIAHGGEQTRQAAHKDEGITRIREGIATHRIMGADIGSTYWLLLLVEGYRETGQIKEGLQALDDAFAVLERTGEQGWEAELYRLKGELTLQSKTSRGQVEGKSKSSQNKSEVRSPESEAEECFLKAVEIARHQQAKSLELRATMSLARLWQRQGKHHEARSTLSDIYNWFTEGFDTKDLQEAKALLEDLEK